MNSEPVPCNFNGLLHQRLQAVDGARTLINGRPVINFAATNYLGLNKHPGVIVSAVRALGRWGTFTGMPRVLATDPLTRRLETAIRHLVGHEIAVVFPATLHISQDVIPMLSLPGGIIFVDERAYPISLVGVRAAARCGARVYRFPHNDSQALHRLLETYTSEPRKLIICDGIYPTGGHLARISTFQKLASAYNALLYIDDAHGIGLYGACPTAQRPYGADGSGTPAYVGAHHEHLVHVGSLSKAFGVPIAFVAGTRAIIAPVLAHAPSMVHSSPPSLLNIAAALAALSVHEAQGGKLRTELARCVRRFRTGLSAIGCRLSPNPLFPVQSIYLDSPTAAVSTAQALRESGIWALLQIQPPDQVQGAALRFVITCHHTVKDLDTALETLSKAIPGSMR